MVASYETVEAVIAVIRRHVDDETMQKIVTDLSEVSGNDSFEETIERLNEKSEKSA